MRKRGAIRETDILNVLNASNTPMTAYQILEALKQSEPSIAPPTVYRALATLTTKGRAHKLESIKAFVPCRCEHGESVPVLAICEDCGQVEEHNGETLMPKLSRLVEPSKFKSDRHILEIHGQCQNCIH